MACLNCGCKVCYQFDDHLEDSAISGGDDRLERCSACGAVFDIDDHAEEDEDFLLNRR